ncbi:hypothetical protein AVEN_128753-1 [Araneus ventricosus]|uniref:Uncharacterized protein n=1 Tax=Araneus ventricosus TaxID=182803 RepID=A0A4Y2NSU9_ARAVE|nr:hypothetical protein AVEN_128753-1 [Araneus ventricosus]
MLEQWQTPWNNGDTGRKIYNIMPSVSLRPTNWIREAVIFCSEDDPFPAYLKTFQMSDSDYCSCGGIGKALHYVSEYIFTVSWHMRKPVTNFEHEGLKRIAKTDIFSGFPRDFISLSKIKCCCGGTGMSLHFATECVLTLSWQMRRTAPNIEQEWLKIVANNLVSWQKHL